MMCLLYFQWPDRSLPHLLFSQPRSTYKKANSENGIGSIQVNQDFFSVLKPLVWIETQKLGSVKKTWVWNKQTGDWKAELTIYYGAEYLVFVSSHSLKTREKYTNWDNLVCLSLNITLLRSGSEWPFDQA